jgi:hypothetical protein
MKQGEDHAFTVNETGGRSEFVSVVTTQNLLQTVHVDQRVPELISHIYHVVSHASRWTRLTEFLHRNAFQHSLHIAISVFFLKDDVSAIHL